MNIIDIIVNYLIEHHYDGLYNEEIECSCEIDDIVPCDELNPDQCKPGYLKKCSSCSFENLCGYNVTTDICFCNSCENKINQEDLFKRWSELSSKIDSLKSIVQNDIDRMIKDEIIDCVELAYNGGEFLDLYEKNINELNILKDEIVSFIRSKIKNFDKIKNEK